jgi:heme exporter protein CcmD
MDWGAKYAGFVIAAYAVSFAGIALMLAFVFYRDRQMKRELGRTRGDTERSP